MKKRLLSLLLSAALLCGALPTAFAGYENFTPKTTYTDGRFSDVSSSDWFYENVRVLCRGGNIRDRAVRDAVDRLECAARKRPGQHGRKFTAARGRVIICKRPGQDAVAARVVDIGLIPR